MENNILKIISGDFEGTFSTNQKKYFQSFEELNSDDCLVNIHEGEATNIKNFTEVIQNNSQDFNFSEVKNIQIHPGNEWIYDNKRIFDIKDFTLTNIEILSTWQLNGKTFGKIKGRFYGSVLKKNNKISEENNPTRNNENKEDNSNSSGENNSNSKNSSNSENDSNSSKGESFKNIPNQEVPSTPVEPKNKFLNPGCIPNIWKWLRWLILLIILLWLLKQCTAIGKNLTCYVKKWRLENNLEDLKTESDTLKTKIEENKVDIEPCAQKKADGFNHVDIQYFDLGEQSGKVKIHYDMYNEPDMLEMFYDGELINSTFENVRGEGFLNWNYQYKKHKPTNFMLKLIPGPATGTKWIYSVHCPK